MIWLGATVAVPLIYAFAVWNSLRKIDTFCNNVQIGVAVGALRQIGEDTGVALRGPFEYPKNSGRFVIVAASPFTVGEYKCRIEATATHVTRKYRGYK